MHLSSSIVTVLFFTVLVVSCRPAETWDCVCNPRECEPLEPSGCPGLGVIVWDPCRCCKVCARTLGETCGGFSGTCEPGLSCDQGTCSDQVTTSEHHNTHHHHHHHNGDHNDMS